MATPTSGTPPEPFDWKKWLKQMAIWIVILVVLIFVCPILFGLMKRAYNWASPPTPAQKSDGMAVFGAESRSQTPTNPAAQSSSAANGLQVQQYRLMELHSYTNTGVYRFAPGEKVKLVGAPAVQFRMSLNPRLYIYSPGAELGDGASSTNRVVFVENQSPDPESVRIIVEPK